MNSDLPVVDERAAVSWAAVAAGAVGSAALALVLIAFGAGLGKHDHGI